MPRGDKSSYTVAQKRKAAHIEKSYRDQGVEGEEAAARAWATVNKQSGGGEKSGSGRSTPEAAKKAARKSSARRAAQTRARCPAERKKPAAKGAAAKDSSGKRGKR